MTKRCPSGVTSNPPRKRRSKRRLGLPSASTPFVETVTPVDDAFFVGSLDGLGDLSEEPDRFIDRNRMARDPLHERFALDQLHHQVVDMIGYLEPVQGGDAGVVQRSEEPSFALETRNSFWVPRERFGKDFDGDFSAELGVARAINVAHPAGAQLERISYKPSFVPGFSAIARIPYQSANAVSAS